MTSSAPRAEPIRIAVFARAPIPGEVKTRLVPFLGADPAAALHAGLVRHALAAAVGSRLGAVELWCTPDEGHPFFERCRDEFRVSLHRQAGTDLGERMRHALERSLGAGSPMLLIGSDCPALVPAHLQAARDALGAHDAVVIPAEDGGYVLIGLAARAPHIFEGIDWGSAAVMTQTRARFALARVHCVELDPLWDVDRPEDYARLRREGLASEVLS